MDVSYASATNIKRALARIGFIAPKPGRRYFESEGCAYAVEFPSAPLAIGDESVSLEQTSSVKTPKGVLRLLSPTDCVKDRLSHYCHWKDAQGLAQAVLVARRQPVKMGEIKRWLISEGFPELYAEFATQLEK
ncbi:hypothetical protein [Microbulbifer donghaiensis]|uniref:hypothetical protein n=1 Tax=Microbulbifer donghaiensis TaxID=494016 RepID=UPI0011613105|nr:hypothetical protein [Microbulbifer donghaiensis]